METKPFDTADYLDSPEMIEEYLNAAFETADPRLIKMALGNAARAVGMSEIAGRSGLNRQNLYRALSEEADPRLETLIGVIRALGLRLSVAA